MLTFLRKIRRSLIESGGSRRYLIYALGEITLVVVGILIALQINNWNEWRKERIAERKVLEEVAKTLELNLDLIEKRLTRINQCQNSGKIILSVIEEHTAYNDSLDYHFWLTFYNVSKVFLSEAGYQPLRSTGAKVILNEKLKSEIINLFEVNYRRLVTQLDWGVRDDPETNSYIDENFWRTPQIYLKPYNFEDIVDDRILHSLVRKAIAQRGWFSLLLSQCKEETQRVLQLVNGELGVNK